MKVGIIGTGMLGESVGLHLLEKNFELFIYNRTKSKTNKLVSHGAKICSTPAEVATESNLVITVVKDADAVNDVSFGINGIIYGKHDSLVVADMSTINPISSKKIFHKYQEHGIQWLDTPVMGGPNVAINGELVLMASGDKESFEKFKQVFDTIANKTFYLGQVGTAHSIKLAMNLQIALLALALSEGITLARAANVDPEIFLKILNSTYFKTGMSENKAFKMIKDEFNPTFTLENLRKDLSTINHAAKEFGVELPMGKKALDVYEKAVKYGFGNLDYTGILAFLKKQTKFDNLQN